MWSSRSFEIKPDGLSLVDLGFELPNFMTALPEIFVLAMACVILIVDLYLSDRRRAITYHLSLLTHTGPPVLTVLTSGSGSALTFSDTFLNDNMARVLKLFIYLITAVVFVYSRDYLVERELFKGEYFVLGLFGVLGMMVMVSAHSFLTVYLGLELLSLCLYAMVALQRDSVNASEAAMKYFVLGALSSGMLLYGMSMFYGATGTLDLSALRGAISRDSHDLVLVFGVAFIIVGLAFKLGAVPFHMWIPDVYHGAPTSVTLYISTVPKIAAYAMTIRLLADGMQGLHDQWQHMVVILAVLSMVIGNVVAIAQSNIKRMLAYSTIAHVGFLLLGVLTGTAAGYAASMFYVIVYALMSMGGFGMIILLSRAGFEADRLEDFKGLNQRSPWFAAMMLILMFSMAGVPPTVGFYAKLSVLKAVIDVDMVWIAVIAVIMSVIGAYYYLRLVKLMYFDDAEDNTPLQASADMRLVMSANGLAILLLGILPGPLMGVCAVALGAGR